MQNQDQSNNHDNQQPATAPPVNQQDPSQNTQVNPSTVPTGKEHEPQAITHGEAQNQQEPTPQITSSEHPEVNIPGEVKNVVEHGPDAKEPVIPKQITQSQSNPPQPPGHTITTPSGVISLPMTYAQAMQTKKTTGSSDSLHWLAALIMYQWRKHDPDAAKETK
jgi:hypothetical protein